MKRLIQLWTGFNPGLTARLGVAFAAVAVLALAANSIAEKGAKVVSRTLTREVIAAPKPALAPVPRAVPVVAPEPTPEPLPAAVPVRPDPARLLAAVERFELAVQSRTQLDAAKVALIAAAKAFDGGANRLKKNLADYTEKGEGIVANADERQSAAQRYVQGIDTLQLQVRQQFDGAWKVLGRVVARQYLVDLRDSAEFLGREANGLLAGPTLSDGAHAQLLAAQVIVDERFEAAQARVGRKELAWIETNRRELAALALVRDRVAELDGKRAGAVADLSKSKSALEARIQSIVNAVPRAAAVAKQKAASAVLATPVPPLDVAAPATITPTPVTETVVTTSHERDAKADNALAWISGAVLVLILAISVATVRSITLQIRRLQQASKKIASGETVSVPPGGIKELDALAATFNVMSSELGAARSAARRYQTELETRVEERTRQLLHQATHDPLTQLPNRRELFTLLDAAITSADRNGLLTGVFFIDLDNFKHVNDSMGHAFGDRVLAAMSERLRHLSADWGFAARLGGDEFTVVMAAARDAEEIRAAGWSVVRAFQQPLLVEGRELLLSVSVGASMFPEHERNAEALLQAADAALFRAKALGRSQLTVFTPELLDAAESKFSTEQGLRRAVERGEFELVFQPEVSIGRFEVDMVEALLRWRLPDGRYAPPGEFLAVAEESGLIMEISDWVLREAIAVAANWHHGEWPTCRVAINVSARQLLDVSFVDRVAQLLKQHRLPAHCIEIELTENVLQTGSATIRTLEGLRALGVPIALDDFGTGYSSLTSLEILPLSRVKVDRSLIAELDTSPRAAAITRAIIDLCHGIGLAVTVEGVERLEQLQVLLKHPDLLIQGFLLSKPIAASQIVTSRKELPQFMESLLLSMPPRSTNTAVQNVTSGAHRSLDSAIAL